MDCRALCLLMPLGVSLAGCPFGPGDDTLELSGHVYESVTCSALDSPCTPVGPPVPGAVVGTSLDSETAVTDAAGFFDLRSGSTPDPCGDYTIVITATGFPTYSITRAWGFRATEQIFGLRPPSPNETNPRVC